MPTAIDATYLVVTPMFCAGANDKVAELRLPSFKGMLRFWWRALAWSRFGGDLSAVQREEDTLFGSADGGRSRVSMRLAEPPPPGTHVAQGDMLRVPKTNKVVGQGARYLGYGLMEAFDGRKTRAGRLARSCFRAPFKFTVQMRVRSLEQEAAESLMNSLVAMGTLGGMGAKSRKGYGSLVLQALRVYGEERWRKPQREAELARVITSLSVSAANSNASSLPDYTAISSKSRHVLVTSGHREPVELLNLVGRELVRYRSWGHNGRVLDGVPRERVFEDDHELMKMHPQSRRTHPRRIAFGLPHNYGKGERWQVGPADRQLDRRASPLFVHIHECGKLPVAVLSFMPARFLKEGKSDISVGGAKVRQCPEKVLYGPIHDFLDRLLDATRRKEPFATVDEVTK